MKCITCKRILNSAYNIYTENKVTRTTIKDDLQAIIGSRDLPDLQDQAYTCMNCKQMVCEVSKIKRRLSQVILKTRKLKSPINYGRYWEYRGRPSPVDQEGLLNSPYAPSLTPVSTVIDHDIGSSTGQRPPSSRSVASSVGNSEVAQYFNEQNSERPLSSSTYKSTRSASSRSQKVPHMKFDERGNLKSVQLRSVSRLMQHQYEQFYCSECSYFIEDLTKYTRHMVETHDLRALYQCYMCDTYYLNKSDLKLHERIHDESFYICPLCRCNSNNMSSFQYHINEHIRYSVPCQYCDLSFLSKLQLKRHISKTHMKEKRKLQAQKPYRIQYRIKYKDDKELESEIAYQARDYILTIQNDQQFIKNDTLDIRLNRGTFGVTECDNNENYDDDHQNSYRMNNDSTPSNDSSGSEINIQNGTSRINSSAEMNSTTEMPPDQGQSNSSDTINCSEELFNEEEISQFLEESSRNSRHIDS